MDRTKYPVTPEAVVTALRKMGAARDPDIETTRRCPSPVRITQLMAALDLGPEQRGKFAQQLQDMQHKRLREFGVHHAYYPTGWQIDDRYVKKEPVDAAAASVVAS